MFYFLSEFDAHLSILNVFRYITFRTGAATVTGLFFVFLFGRPIIRALKVRQGDGQPIREDGPESHLMSKKGTPTMGGLMILAGLLFSTLLWADLSNPYVWIVLGVTLGFGMVGLYDDYLKVTKTSHKGFGGKARLAIESLIAGTAAIMVMRIGLNPEFTTSLTFPFLKGVLLDLGIFFVPFSILVMVGSGNAVNLTDGLDGLAIVPVMIAAASFGMIAYLSGNEVFSDYLQIHFVRGTGELAVICGAVLGAGLGFLWFNAPPAAIFMGDTGSLALGGMLGAIAVTTKHEIVLAIIGGIFVAEAVSVIIQVVAFRTTGKRVFLMAPIHHHFEKMGWTEGFAPLAFQSKFGREKWLEPATEATIKRLAGEGVKNLAIIMPGFVSDCIETLEEIDIAGRETFMAAGGEAFTAIPCLNDAPEAIALFETLARRETAGWL